MPKSFDVIVIGVGAMGAATCYQLAKCGARTLGIEQFGIPNQFGSSHGHTRLIRLAYYEHPDYVPLLRQSYNLWSQLECESESTLLYRVGGIYLGGPESDLVDHSLKAASIHQLPHSHLTRQDISDQFPQFTVPDHYHAVYEPDAGFLMSELAIQAFADQATRLGADIHTNEVIVNYKASPRGVVVTTSQDTYHAQNLILTVGAWAGSVIRDLGVELRVTRQSLCWFKPSSPTYLTLGVLPVWAIDLENAENPGIYYGFPILPDETSIKAALHQLASPATPDTVDREPRPEDHFIPQNALKTYLPSAHGPLSSCQICMYTNSPDGHFIIDQHPLYPNVSFAAGFSGHGFKFAPVIGQILADLALNQSTDLPVEFLSRRRFQ